MEFDFKVNKKLGDMIELYIYDIIYHAKQTEDGEFYDVSWCDTVSRKIRSIRYSHKEAHKMIDDEDWIVI